MTEALEQSGASGSSYDPKHATLLPFHDPGFVAPTHSDVRALTRRYSLTGATVARITGVLPRTVRKWLASPEVTNHTAIPYAAWRLLLIETGLVKPTGIGKLHHDDAVQVLQDFQSGPHEV